MDDGKFGSALSFNGTSARVTVSDSAALRLTTGMTLSAWVNPSTTAIAWREVIYKGSDTYYLEASSPFNGAWAAGGTVGTNVTLYGPTALTNNAWSHLAATYDGAVLRLYINGVEAGQVLRSGALATSSFPMEIGGNGLNGQFFQGKIDEVRVYNVALTAAQIQVDMSTPLGAIGDTTAPSAPGTLSTAPAAGDQAALAWGAATDNVGVTGYLVERCGGAGCASFAQIGTTSGSATTYSDPGLAPGQYQYRVRAQDAADNVGAYSNVAAFVAGFGVSPRAVSLTPGQTRQFTATQAPVTWAVDGVAGGTVGSGTITAGGLYTAPAGAGTHTVTATTDQAQVASATVYVTAYPGTYTHHNDTMRTGQNLDETVLTPGRVSAATFGKLFSYALDGPAYASPLYVSGVAIPGKGLRNVVYVATTHDTVYAFDADGRQSAPLWQVSFINPAAGVTTVPPSDTQSCCDIYPELGITGTPVIDPASGTLYVVAKTKEVSGTVQYVQRLHALDITTGAERANSPVVLDASVPGTGTGSVGGVLAFNPLRHNQRPALLLSQGVVYIAFAAHGDAPPYHGWVLGYDADTLAQTLAWVATPNGEGAGIWMGGGGLAADAAGAVYFVTADGTFDVHTGGVNYGDSFVKLDPTVSPYGQVLDYFTPHDQAFLDSGNHDLGSGGLLLLPDQPGPRPRLMLLGSKDGTLYLVNRDTGQLGGYNPTDDSQIVQSFVHFFSSNLSAPVYYNGSVYLSGMSDRVKEFVLNNGLLTTPGASSQTAEVYGFPGAAMAISANGGSGGHPVDDPAERDGQPRGAARVSGGQSEHAAVREHPGGDARCDGLRREVHGAAGRQRQGVRGVGEPAHRVRTLALTLQARGDIAGWVCGAAPDWRYRAGRSRSCWIRSRRSFSSNGLSWMPSTGRSL